MSWRNADILDIESGIQEYYEFQNPIFDEEWWCRLSTTLFDIIVGSKEEDAVIAENDSPVDAEWYLSIDFLWDIKTGKINKDMFKIVRTYNIKDKTYNLILVPWSNKIFVVDFKNRKVFPWFEKWLSDVSYVGLFWDKEIIIFESSDEDVKCIDNTWEQIGKDSVSIKKLEYWKIDILEFISRRYPDRDHEDIVKSYLWSDGKQYKPKTEGTLSFEEI